MTSYRGFTCLDDWTFTSEYATCNNAYFNRNPEKENILEQKTLLECQTACTDNGQCKAMRIAYSTVSNVITVMVC